MITELISTQTAQGLQQQAGQIQNQVNKFNAELNSISRNQAQLSDPRGMNCRGCVQGIVAQTEQTKTNPQRLQMCRHSTNHTQTLRTQRY